MGRPKKNKDEAVETQPEFAKDVCCSVSPNRDEVSGLLLEAPEVFLDSYGVAVEVKDRNFEDVPLAIRQGVTEVSKTTSTHSMNNTELYRTLSAKIRARKLGRKISRSGKIKANFNIG